MTHILYIQIVENFQKKTLINTHSGLVYYNLKIFIFW